jgi:carboxymethylenebutenolidase
MINLSTPDASTPHPSGASAVSTVTVPAGDGQSFQAYVSRPAAPNGRAIIVLQEIFGVTHAIRDVADRFAAEGYLALAPDLFWRIRPGIELSHSKEDIALAFDALKQFDESLAVQDIDRVVEHIHGEMGPDAPVAVLGMCLGGKLAYLCAARIDVSAAVSFYGVGIEKNLDEADKVSCPLLLHIGARDNYIHAMAREQIAHTLATRPGVALHVYEQAGHGFYTREASTSRETAHERTMAFLEASLGSAA